MRLKKAPAIAPVCRKIKTNQGPAKLLRLFSRSRRRSQGIENRAARGGGTRPA
jgi:hypothetical protein